MVVKWYGKLRRNIDPWTSKLERCQWRWDSTSQKVEVKGKNDKSWFQAQVASTEQEARDIAIHFEDIMNNYDK